MKESVECLGRDLKLRRRGGQERGIKAYLDTSEVGDELFEAPSLAGCARSSGPASSAAGSCSSSTLIR